MNLARLLSLTLISWLFLSACITSTPSVADPKTLGPQKAKDYEFVVERVASTKDVVWGFTFLDSKFILLTHRGGDVYIVDLPFGKARKVTGGFQVDEVGQGGLLDVELHPKFGQNRWVYFTFARRGSKSSGYTTMLGRIKLKKDNTFGQQQLLLETRAHASGGRHFGSRIVFTPKGELFMTVGDRGDRDRSQQLNSHAGKVLRLTDEGKPHPGNPFLNRKGVLPEIYSYGHRNPQGMTLDPDGRVWLHEHGPRGGDEINLVRAGKNYGWPVITYGREYSGFKVGEGKTAQAGMEQPVKYYTPSIAPSGMIWYTGMRFPKWRNSLFNGALVLTHLNRVAMKDGAAVAEERLLENMRQRVRSVEQGPDGLIYIGTDSGDILRLKPKS